MTQVIGSDGRIKDRMGLSPQGIVFSVNRNTSQTISASTWTKIQFNSKDFDPFNYFDTTTNYRFQPLIAGYYRLSGAWENNSAVTAGYQAVCSVWKNGAEYKRGGSFYGGTGGNQPQMVSCVVYLNGTTDYVELYAYSQAATATDIGTAATNAYFQGELIGASVGVLPEPWHTIGATGEPAFQNSWTNLAAGSPAMFMKDPNGFVHLRSLISTGTVGSVAFTLPVGYRPATFGHAFGTISNSAIGRVDVAITGNVTPITPSSNAWVSLDGLTFRAEQ